MTGAGNIILEFMRQAWVALAAAVMIFAVLALLAQVLRAAASSVVGSRHWMQESLGAITGIMGVALFGFLGVPVIVRAASTAINWGCGGALPGGLPGQSAAVVELGSMAAGLIGALAAIRIIKAVFVSVAMASVGGSASLSGVLLEAGEAVIGMALVGVAGPVAMHFLGVCS